MNDHDRYLEKILPHTLGVLYGLPVGLVTSLMLRSYFRCGAGCAIATVGNVVIPITIWLCIVTIPVISSVYKGFEFAFSITTFSSVVVLVNLALYLFSP